MEQVSPGFSERYLLDPRRFQSELMEYKKYVKSMVELAGAGNMSANYANEILEFGTKLAKVNVLRLYYRHQHSIIYLFLYKLRHNILHLNF